MNDLDIFPVDFRNPDYGLTGTPTFLVDTVELGDRAKRRIKKGINNKFLTWNLIWNNITLNELERLEEFFYGLEGIYPFLWQHPTNGKLYKCHCEEYSTAHDIFERYNFTATFVEEV